MAIASVEPTARAVSVRLACGHHLAVEILKGIGASDLSEACAHISQVEADDRWGRQSCPACAATVLEPRLTRTPALVADAGQWLRCRAARGGRKWYGVPASRPGRYYVVPTASCTCPDFARRGGPSKHLLAVRIHLGRLRTGAALPRAA